MLRNFVSILTQVNDFFDCNKAKITVAKTHPFICQRNFLNEKFGNQKN